VAKVELNVDRSVYDGSCDVMRRAVDFAGSIKQGGIVPFCLEINANSSLRPISGAANYINDFLGNIRMRYGKYFLE